jgi:hypothetical protein
VLGGVVAAVGAIAVAAIVLKIWLASPRVPFALGGDTNGALAIVKNQLHGGWYLTTSHLGAPFGEKLFDYANVGDGFALLVFKLFGLFTGDPALAVNAFFLLTFPLVAVGCFVGLRVLRVQTALASALAIAYSILPYHFQRGESHLFLTTYFAVPLACAVLVRQMSPATMVRLPRRSESLRKTVFCRGNVGALFVCVLIAGTGLYYAFFFVVLLAAIAVFGTARNRSFRPLLSSGLMVMTVLGLLLLANVPSLIYWSEHGNHSPQRPVADTERYGLKVENLVLPVTGHRVGALADLKAKTLDGSPVPSEGTEALGLIGAVGFIGLMAVAVSRLAWRAEYSRRAAGGPEAIVAQMSALTVLCILLAVVGGGSTVIAALGLTTIRGWNRISVYIGFFSLAAVGIWLTAIVSRSGIVTRRRAWSIAIAAAVVLFAAFDQTTPAFTPDYSTIAGQYGVDRTFVGHIEAVLGHSASIFQLPYIPYPENPPVYGMTDYDHLRGYLHSDSLRWSYGGVKGGDTEWQPALLENATPVVLTAIAAVGFTGLYVDRAGYSDRAKSLEVQLQQLLGAPLFESQDRRLVIYDLRPLRQRLTATLRSQQLQNLRNAVLYAPRPNFGTGFYGGESNGAQTWHWAMAQAELDLENPASRPRTIRVSFGVDSLDPRAQVTVDGLGPRVKLSIGGNEPQLSRRITLKPGVTRILFRSTAVSVPVAGETRDLHFQVVDLNLVGSPLVDAVHTLGLPSG